MVVAETIYMKSPSQSNGELILKNAALAGRANTYIAAVDTFDNLTAVNMQLPINADTTITDTASFTGSTVTLANDINLESVRIDIGTTTFTTSGFVDAETITLFSGTTLTHPQGNTRGVRINATDVDIQAGAVINLDTRGYSAASGPGAGLSGGNRIAGSGAGHGGYGGNSWGNSGSKTGGSQYGSLHEPTLLGSGGGSSSHAGGNGGGYVRMDIADTLTIDGTITTDGGNGGATCNDYSSGGGVRRKCLHHSRYHHRKRFCRS